MPFFHMKIRHKLPLLAILLSVAPVLFLSVVMLNVNRDTSRQDYRMLLSNQAKASAQHLSSLYRAQKSGVVYASHLEIYREYLQVLRSGDTARAAVLRATIEDLQRIAVATDASISHVTLADANARVVAYSGVSRTETSLENCSAYRRALEHRSDAYEILSTEQGRFIRIAYPITDADGRTLGAILRELNLDGIKSYVANLRIGQEGYLFVLDRNGELLTSTDSVTRTVERELATNEALRALAADTKNGQAAMRDTFMSFTLGGQESFAASSIVPMTGWVAVAAVPVREINQSTQLQTSIFLWTALATGVTSLGIALWFVRAITAPLGTLIENINRVADGQFEYTAHEHRKDEFVQVYDAVNLMAHRLNASYNQLSTAAHTDMLTGLANRKAVYEMMERRFSAHCAAFMVDLDGFKEVNDRYGHDIGDAVLIAVADVLRELEQDDVCVARLGGDEFFVFLRSMTRPPRLFPRRAACARTCAPSARCRAARSILRRASVSRFPPRRTRAIRGC